ncbi:hypothetical protein HMPREF0880_01831 [Yokenella regensburgei ATCC 43003]|nr:hypothetical protein HMPREF0880_01831 [Yokenella regensburgei ATCC 43003]
MAGGNFQRFHRQSDPFREENKGLTTMSGRELHRMTIIESKRKV